MPGSLIEVIVPEEIESFEVGTTAVEGVAEENEDIKINKSTVGAIAAGMYLQMNDEFEFNLIMCLLWYYYIYKHIYLGAVLGTLILGPIGGILLGVGAAYAR